MGACQHVDGEDAGHQIGPASAGSAPCLWEGGLFRMGFVTCGHDVAAPAVIGGEDAVVADGVLLRPGDQGGELFDKLEWGEDDVGCAIGVGAF